MILKLCHFVSERLCRKVQIKRGAQWIFKKFSIPNWIRYRLRTRTAGIGNEGKTFRVFPPESDWGTSARERSFSIKPAWDAARNVAASKTNLNSISSPSLRSAIFTSRTHGWYPAPPPPPPSPARERNIIVLQTKQNTNPGPIVWIKMVTCKLVTAKTRPGFCFTSLSDQFLRCRLCS